MAADAAQKGDGIGPILVVALPLLAPILIVLFLILGQQMGSAQPNQRGATAAQSIQLGDNSPVKESLATLRRFTKPDQFLTQNSTSSIQDMQAGLKKLSDLFNTGGALENNPNKADALALIGNMNTELTLVSTNVNTNKTLAAEKANNFLQNRDKLDELLQSKIGQNNVPLFKQRDYADVAYPNQDPSRTLSTSGCGIMAAAMVLNFYNKNTDPATLAQYSLANNFRVSEGTSWSFFPAIASKYSLHSDTLTDNWDGVIAALKAGHPVIASGKGDKPFTFGGHFVVLTGLNADGSINVNDSAGGADRDGRSYSAAHIKAYYHFATAIYP